jgi:hypothetical protein
LIVFLLFSRNAIVLFVPKAGSAAFEQKLLGATNRNMPHAE